MTDDPLTVHMITASPTPGDAIANYMMTSAKIWRRWGARVELYADYVAPAFADITRPTKMYPGKGNELLWYHYSIYADNVNIARNSPDLKIMDFHGIAPRACSQGITNIFKLPVKGV